MPSTYSSIRYPALFAKTSPTVVFEFSLKSLPTVTPLMVSTLKLLTLKLFDL
jgi:hypothetical protein